jgi:hypothetical protein
MMTFLVSVSCEVFGRHMGWTSVDGRSTFTQDFSLSWFIYEKDKKEKKVRIFNAGFFHQK